MWDELKGVHALSELSWYKGVVASYMLVYFWKVKQDAPDTIIIVELYFSVSDS